MADQVSVEEVADAMFKQVEAAQGLKKLKPNDVSKLAIEIYGDRVDKKLCKKAIRLLIESERCVYSYFGGSYIEVKPPEGTEK